MLNPEWGIINSLIFRLTGADGPNWLNDPTLALAHRDARAHLEVAAVLDADPDRRAGSRFPPSSTRPRRSTARRSWQKFRFITWPSMRTLYLTCTILSMIWTLGDFNSVYLLTGGGPADLTHVLATLGIRYLRLDQVDLSMAAIVVALPAVLPLVYFMMKRLSQMSDAALRDVTTEAKLLLIGIPVLHLDDAADLPPVPVRDLAQGPGDRRQAVARRTRRCTTSRSCSSQQHHYLNHFWLQMWNSLIIAVAVGVLTLFVATGAAFAISRLKVRGGRTVMNLALFTYFIPAAFLAVPMYKTMGVYGLLNNQWSLILAMVTIASPYSIWVLKQASDKLPFELDEAARMDGASPLQLFRLVYLPLMTPSLVAVGTYALLLAWNEYLYAFLLLSNDTRHHARRRARQLPRRRRFAVGAADDHRPHLRAAAGGDLLHVQALHGRRPDRRRREELTTGATHGIRLVPQHREVLRHAPRSSTASASTSPTASSSCWSARRAAASRRCCGCWPGLEEITGGTIAIDGKVVNDVESKDRDIAMVFQSYALYPHMTVARQHGVQPEAAQGRPEDDRGARRARVEDPEPRSVPATAFRASSPAASASAWRWAARSCATRRSSCSTSRCRTSTPSCASRCAPRSRRCTSG